MKTRLVKESACRARPTLAPGDLPHAYIRIRRTCRGHASAVSAARPSRQGVGSHPCRNTAGATARPGPGARQPRVAIRHGGRVRRHGRRRGVGMERRLRRARGGAGSVPAQIWRRDAVARRLVRCHARDAHASCRAARFADAPVGRIRTAAAILDADRARLRRLRGGCAHLGRPRSRTVRRHGAAGDFCRARQSTAHTQRDCRYARRPSDPFIPRRRGRPPQRRADPRPARSRDPADRRSDEPALLGLA